MAQAENPSNWLFSPTETSYGGTGGPEMGGVGANQTATTTGGTGGPESAPGWKANTPPPTKPPGVSQAVWDLLSPSEKAQFQQPSPINFGGGMFNTNAGSTNPLTGDFSAFNPNQYATLQGAQELAKLLGGTVVGQQESPSYNTQTMNLRLGNGAMFNAGLVMDMFNRGMSLDQVKRELEKQSGANYQGTMRTDLPTQNLGTFAGSSNWTPSTAVASKPALGTTVPQTTSSPTNPFQPSWGQAGGGGSFRRNITNSGMPRWGGSPWGNLFGGNDQAIFDDPYGRSFAQAYNPFGQFGSWGSGGGNALGGWGQSNAGWGSTSPTQNFWSRWS